MLPPWVYTLVAVSVTAVWLLAHLVSLLTVATVDPGLNYIMGIVVGGTFGAKALTEHTRKVREADAGVRGDQ